MILSRAYVEPPKTERPLNELQPYGRQNALLVETVDYRAAMAGVPDPIRQSVQLTQRWAMRPARMRIFLGGRTPEVMNGWQDLFTSPWPQDMAPPNIQTTSVGGGMGGQKPWSEKTNIRKPRSQTYSRLMDILTGQV